MASVIQRFPDDGLLADGFRWEPAGPFLARDPPLQHLLSMMSAACLLELELCSPWFDATAPRLAATPQDPEDRVQPAPVAAGPPRLLLLLAPPRSGSHHLSRLLWLHGYGRPAEYLNPHLRQALARFTPGWPQPQRDGRGLARWLARRFRPQQRPWGWWSQLVAERSTLSCRSGQPFFAIKLQRGQMGTHPRELCRTLQPLAQRGLWRTFVECPPLLIALFRSDWRRAVLSHHLALCTGAFDEGRIVSFQHRPLSALGDPAALADDLAAYRQHLAWLLACADRAGFPVWVVEHEALVRKQQAMLAELFQFIEGHPAAEGSASAPPLALPIARERTTWALQKQAWLDHLQERFVAAGLEGSQDALMAQDLVNHLRSRLPPSSR